MVLDDKTYTKITRAIYGVGGDSRLISPALSRLLRAFEAVNKEAFVKAMKEICDVDCSKDN